MIYPSLPYCLCFAADATPSLATTNPEEVQSLFAAQLNVFDPISGNPTDTDLARLCEELITILIPLPYNVEKVIHNLLGLVMYKEYYEQRYC